MIETIKFDLSDYLIAEIAVVDQSGAIVHCNRKWEETAKTGMLFLKPAGWNYIEECEAAIVHIVHGESRHLAVLLGDQRRWILTLERAGRLEPPHLSEVLFDEVENAIGFVAPGSSDDGLALLDRIMK